MLTCFIDKQDRRRLLPSISSKLTSPTKASPLAKAQQTTRATPSIVYLHLVLQRLLAVDPTVMPLFRPLHRAGPAVCPETRFHSETRPKVCTTHPLRRSLRSCRRSTPRHRCFHCIAKLMMKFACSQLHCRPKERPRLQESFHCRLYRRASHTRLRLWIFRVRSRLWSRVTEV